MHDLSDNSGDEPSTPPPAEMAAWSDVAAAPEIPAISEIPAPAAVPPEWQPTPEPGRYWARRKLVWVAFAVAVLLAVAAAAVGYMATREEPVRFAVKACVSLKTETPVEYGCADSNALYRIVAREDVVYPLESACMKYSDVTKAVARPVSAGDKPRTVLCLAPTRFNMTDPGALQAGDCVNVKGAGDTMDREPCGANVLQSKVLSTELHLAVPVTDHACKDQPKTRIAYAQTSLGGRAFVVCAIATDPTSVDTAEVGGCTDRELLKLVSCTDPTAEARVLAIRTVFQRPGRPQCPDVLGAHSSSNTSSEKTDFVLALCLGPVDPNDSAYSKVGDCIAVAGTGPAAHTRRLDCGDPEARFQVLERHGTSDGVCEMGTAHITIDAGVTNGSTICLTRR